MKEGTKIREVKTGKVSVIEDNDRKNKATLLQGEAWHGWVGTADLKDWLEEGRAEVVSEEDELTEDLTPET